MYSGRMQIAFLERSDMEFKNSRDPPNKNSGSELNNEDHEKLELVFKTIEINGVIYYLVAM